MTTDARSRDARTWIRCRAIDPQLRPHNGAEAVGHVGVAVHAPHAPIVAHGNHFTRGSASGQTSDPTITRRADEPCASASDFATVHCSTLPRNTITT